MTALSIRGNHFFHAMRSANVNLTYTLMDDQMRVKTKGRTAPTSGRVIRTKSTPHGNPDIPVDPVLGCAQPRFIHSPVAQGISSNPKQVAELVLGGLLHRGMAFHKRA